jgi:hypothetical protein
MLKDSLKLDKRFLFVLLYDILFYIIIIPSVYVYIYFINKQTELMKSLIGTEDIASYIASASPTEISFLTGDMRALVLTFIIGAVIVFLIGLFSYSLSRSLIWNYLSKKKFDIIRYLKFNVLNLILFFAFLIIFGIYAFLMVLSRTVFGIILIFFMLAIFYFIFSLNLEFIRTGRIFHSIGNAFKRMDKKVYLLSLPVFIIIGVIAVVFGLFFAQILYTTIVVLLLIIFASWMRIFVLETQKKRIV